MKITVLGSSHGNPTKRAFQTSVLLEISDQKYLLDAGDGADSLLIRQGVDPSELSAIFITHMHLDHTSSLPLLLSQANKHRAQYPQITLQLFLPEYDKAQAILDYCKANHGTTGNVQIFDMRRNSFDDGNLKATFLPTKHIAADPEGNACSFAVFFETGAKSVLFTGDLTGDFSDFPQEAATRCSILFCELTHYTLDKALDTFKTLPLEKLIFYHLHDPHQTEEGRKKVLEICKDLPFETALAFDSFTLTV